MTTDLCAQARDLLPAYSIGATNAEDTRFVESQLADCPELAEELRDYQTLSESLLRDVPQVAPPPRLLQNLMAATAAPGTNQQSQHVMPMPFPTHSEPAPSHHLAPNPIVITPQKRKTELRPSLAYSIAAVLLLALIVSNAYWVIQVNRTESERSRWYHEAEELANALDTQVISFNTMRAPDTRWARMASPLDEMGTVPEANEPYAWIIWSAERKEGVLMAQNFPLPDMDKVYQLWGHRGDEDISLTTFYVDTEGKTLVQFDAATWGFERYWITSEPEGGSPAPSGDPFVRVRLS